MLTTIHIKTGARLEKSREERENSREESQREARYGRVIKDNQGRTCTQMTTMSGLSYYRIHLRVNEVLYPSTVAVKQEQVVVKKMEEEMSRK